MAVKLSVFVLVLTVAYAVADAVVPTTIVLNSPMGLSYYPVDTPAYNELKKSLYALSLASANACFDSQGSFDYYNLYNYQGTYQPKLADSLTKLSNAQQYLDEAYNNYLRALAAYKSTIVFQNAAVLSDDVAPRAGFV